MNKAIFSTRNLNNNLAILLLRLSFGGLLLLNHGVGKIEKLLNPPVKFMDFLGLGPTVTLLLVVIAELVCSALIILGLATRLAAAILIFNFCIILFDVHAGDPIAETETAVFYLAAFLAIFITGAGTYSVDNRL